MVAWRSNLLSSITQLAFLATGAAFQWRLNARTHVHLDLGARNKNLGDQTEPEFLVPHDYIVIFDK